MTRLMHGVAHGDTIKLTEDLGIPDGQAVEVVVRAVPSPKAEWGEGLRRCAGAFADDWTEEDDLFLNQLREERENDPRPELPS
jgi:hypothetical protein